MIARVDMRYRFIHACAGCDGSYAECQPLWAEQRKCCPDCTHHRAHPPTGSWRDFTEAEAERDVQMEAGHA